MAVREIEANRQLGLAMVAFIDDNARLHGRRVNGYAVLGGLKDLPEIVRRHGIRKIVVAFRDRGLEKKREIRALCAEMGLEVEVGRMRLIIR